MREDDALLHIPKEPPITRVSHNRERIHDLTPANQRKTEERGTCDDLGVVQVPVATATATPRPSNAPVKLESAFSREKTRKWGDAPINPRII